MKKLMPLLAVLTALACSCAHDPLSRGAGGVLLARGHGDVGQFILQKSIEYHCTPIKTNSLLAISGAWYFLEQDLEPSKAVLVVMSKDHFPTVVAFLREAFGKPLIGPEDIGSGWRYGEYSFGQYVPRIEFTYGAERTQVSIIGPYKK